MSKLKICILYFSEELTSLFTTVKMAYSQNDYPRKCTDEYDEEREILRKFLNLFLKY